jgi:hypothetical protein
MALYERPLITAIKNDDASLVENLIKNGANVNSRDSNEVLALVLAASLGKTEIVKVLLASGEEVRNSASEALLNAVIGGHTEIIQVLLDYGAKINIKDGKYGRTTLMWAIIGKNPEIIKMLLPYLGPNDINATSNIGYTPLIIAVQYEFLEAVQILLAQPDIDINIRDKNNKTALDIAKLLYKMGKLTDIEIIAELHSRANRRTQATRKIKNAMKQEQNMGNLLGLSVLPMEALGPTHPGGKTYQKILGEWENRNMERHDVNVRGGKQRRRKNKTNKKKQKNNKTRKFKKTKKSKVMERV